MAGGKAGDVFGQLTQIGFAVLQNTGGLGCAFRRGVEFVLMAFAGLGQFAAFPFQPFDGFARVAVQPAFAIDILRQLGDAAFQGFDGFRRALFLFGQRIAFDDQALQNGGGNRLFLAQGRQGVFLRFAQLGGLTRGGLGAGGVGQAGA